MHEPAAMETGPTRFGSSGMHTITYYTDIMYNAILYYTILHYTTLYLVQLGHLSPRALAVVVVGVFEGQGCLRVRGLNMMVGESDGEFRDGVFEGEGFEHNG